MMASPSELIFDTKPQIYSMLPKSLGDEASDHTQKLEDFLIRLEEERLKIDAFKRELPLCMQLLANAMEASRQQLQSEKASSQGGGGRPVLEEFIPLKKSNSSKAEMGEGNIYADKANWMTSAQLWNEGAKAPQSPLATSSPQETEIKLALNCKQRTNGSGGLLPFSPPGEAYPELALASSHKEEMDEKRSSSETKRDSVDKDQGCGTATNGAQTHRKARRCWSPDLHRRFVNALHMLGGSQATPKQIRELMKVDGLTNDEVKSHLQKYRLHTRRPSPSPQAAVTAAPQVVVLGGIWVPQEYGGAQAALYGAAAAHHHPFNTPMQQDMYPAIAPPPSHPHAAAIQHQHLQLYNKQQQQPPPLTRNSSPGSGGDPSESIEDGKSESGSWKADSGGANSGERRRVEGEESNASVVSLKF
ncbi:myb family transcription factor EFM-like isoform X2 [Salvia splendens]|uniref:myb family transcription factor EFM-like isoform X2 n=1 Tax=Salvia splendens TaxID=180675 RepID=UPI001C26F346|nr:myb family transcription factor EFM-like isoform X2 [Salvia splendens]